MLRKSLTTVFCVSALVVQTGPAWAASRSARTSTTEKKKVVTTVTVTGPTVKCHAWGYMAVQLKVQKTVTGKNVSIKILSVSWPIYPNHTPRSIYINAQALPLLQGETMELQASAGTKLQNISGASNTTVSWLASLKGALAMAETP